MTQYRRNNPQNRNFNQRERNTYNQPNLRNQQGWRQDYEPTDEHEEWSNTKNRNTEYHPYDTQNERQSPYERNENLGYGQYNYNNKEDRQNPYNGFQNERNPNYGYGRLNEDRESRNYRNQFEPQNNREQSDFRRNYNFEEDYNYANQNQGYGRGSQEYNQNSNSWEDQKGQNRYQGNTEQWASQNSQSHRGKGPKGYVRSNERITDDINDRLSDDDRIDASGIEVKVENNEVILTGTVNSKEEKRRCEDIVDSISGVNNVENRIRIASNSNTLSTSNQSSNDNKGQTSYNQTSENQNTEKSQTDKNKK